MNRLMQLPVKTQNEVKSTLSVYNTCTVEINQDGIYSVHTATVIHCGIYNKQVATFTKDEIFTKDEQIVNYVNSFRDYPINYKGKKNYIELGTNWKIAKLVQGNIIFIKA